MQSSDEELEAPGALGGDLVTDPLQTVPLVSPLSSARGRGEGAAETSPFGERVNAELEPEMGPIPSATLRPVADESDEVLQGSPDDAAAETAVASDDEVGSESDADSDSGTDEESDVEHDVEKHDDESTGPAHFEEGAEAEFGPAHLVEGAEFEPLHFADDVDAADADSGEDAKDESAKKKRKVPLAGKVLIVLLAVIGVAVIAGAAYINSINSTMSMDEDELDELNEVLSEDEDEEEVTDTVDDEAFYVLAIGSDARKKSTTSRSDVIMLCRIDPANATVTLISIPRDTMIYDSNGNVEKINAEYTNGAAATVAAVEAFAGVEISHYVEVKFSGLEDLVDELGGVWVDIPEDISDYKTDLDVEAGYQLLDGETALDYARSRYGVTGGDFGRNQAQRQIVEAIIKQVLACSVTEIPGIISAMAECVSTDLTVGEIVTYALQFKDADDLTIYSASAPCYTLNVNGVSYVGIEYDEWRTMMQLVDACLDPTDDTQEIPEEQLNNELLGAASNSASPTDYEDLVAVAGLTTDDVASLDDDEDETTEETVEVE